MATELAQNQSGGGKAGVLALPFRAEAADRFAEAHGEVDYRLQALRRALAKVVRGSANFSRNDCTSTGISLLRSRSEA